MELIDFFHKKWFLSIAVVIIFISFPTIYCGKPIFAQQSDISSINPKGLEEMSGNKQLTNFKHPSFNFASPFNTSVLSNSLNPPPLNKSEKIENNQSLERTFPKISIPITNQTYVKISNITSSEIIQNNPNRDGFINNTGFTMPRPSVYRIASLLDTLDKIHIYENKSILPPNHDQSNFDDNRLEPSGATDGKTYFVTGNHFSARSTDGGVTWDFNDKRIQCCDQDVIYDKNHKIFIYYLQQNWNEDGINNFTLSISKDAKRWWNYTMNASSILGQIGQGKSFDFPILSNTEKYLYIATNLMDWDNSFGGSIILRISLDDLGNSSSNPEYKYYYSQRVMNFAPVQGATNTMYFAGHLSNSKMAIYKWADTEDDGPPQKFIENISAWKPQPGNYNCWMEDGSSVNYCGKSSDKIISGWMLPNGIIGFFWNVDKNEEAGFPWPYIEAASFDTSKDMKYVGRPLVWSKDFAYQYAFASPDTKGNMGVIVSFGGNMTYPHTAVSISSLGDSPPPPWKFIPILSNGKLKNGDSEWGDFLRIRPFISGIGDNIDSVFVAFPYSINSSINKTDSRMPYMIIFGKSITNLPAGL